VRWNRALERAAGDGFQRVRRIENANWGNAHRGAAAIAVRRDPDWVASLLKFPDPDARVNRLPAPQQFGPDKLMIRDTGPD
jgi:hypothetical protein